MVDVNRADPAAVIVQPLQSDRKIAATHKKKPLVDAIDPDWLDLVVPARANSGFLDQQLATATTLKEPQFLNDSEDDQADYAIR